MFPGRGIVTVRDIVNTDEKERPGMTAGIAIRAITVMQGGGTPTGTNFMDTVTSGTAVTKGNGTITEMGIIGTIITGTVTMGSVMAFVTMLSPGSVSNRAYRSHFLSNTKNMGIIGPR